MISKPTLLLRNRESIGLEELAKRNSFESPKLRLFFGSSGYESRSIGFAKSFDRLCQSPFRKAFQGSVFGYNQHVDVLHRPANDAFFKDRDCTSIPIDTSDSSLFIREIISRVENAKSVSDSNGIEIHIDYSSMPRDWYCRIPNNLEKVIRPWDEVYLWYSGGRYPFREFPTAGIDDFSIFDGVASLSPRARTHFLGLGFDRIRSHAIWSVLDPQTLIAFYASPATLPEYIERVETENADLLLSANHVMKMPINDVAGAIDHLLATTREFRTLGDVVLVPDGPKPFVLATSLIPSLDGTPGIVCFHVRRRKSTTYLPMDVEAYGEPFALRFTG